MSLFFAIFFICMFKALETTTALNTGTLYTLVPFITAMASLVIFKERLTQKMLFIYLLGTAGTCWVIFGGDINKLMALSINAGDGFFIAGCFSMVCFSISMKLLYRGDEMVVVVFCTLLGGAFWMLLALMVFGQPFEFHLLGTDSLGHLGYLAIFSTLATTFIMQKTTVVLGPTKVMAYIYLNPVIVAFMMLLIQGQSIPLMVFPGMLLSISATILLQVQDKNTANHGQLASS